jgi:hypothetical protein
MKEMDNNTIVGAVLLHFSAAFDAFNHNLLLKNVCFMAFQPLPISWIQSYISNRTQRVFFSGSFSNVKHVKCGVPQGSSLSPLLFTIFTNDLSLALNILVQPSNH